MKPAYYMTLYFLYILLILAKVGKSESCSRTVGCEVTQRNDNTIYFGLMLSYPDPLRRKTLAAAFDDGHNIAPAAYLAVEQINNRSDLLSDYQVKLLPVDGGCDVTERTVVGINNLACSCEPVIGIVGPSCGTSALKVGEITGREQFSMITIHYGERNILRNREMFPFAFGMLGSNFIIIQAFTELVIKNDWSKIVLLYSEDDSDPFELSIGIEKNIKATPGFDVAFTSPIYDYFIPLQEIRKSFARVIIVLSSAKATLRTLCLAFHEGVIFPMYQWVFKERFEDDFTDISFSYDGKHYLCTEEDISKSIHGSVNLVWSLSSDVRNRTADGRLALMEYEEGYEKQRNHYMNEYNVSSVPVEWARGIYDAVWSLVFALNSSLEKINTNLTQIVPGSKPLARVIANCMPDIDFYGVSGRIDFDNETGFNTARQVKIYQIREEKFNTLIGFYTSNELVILSNATPQFIKATFDEKRVQVSTAVAVPFLIITVALLLFAVPLQVIDIIYRDHKTIKATSPRLNHLIFLGCYLTVIGMVLYIITEMWHHTHTLLKSSCIAIPWFINIGISVIIGTACLKTWRLYRIYKCSKSARLFKEKRIPRSLTDPVLGATVVAFAFVDLLVCLIWTCVDPLRSYTERKIQVSQGSEVPIAVMAVTVTCQSKWLVYWVCAQIGYKCILIGCSTVLAMLTNIKKKEFRTENIIILAYLLAITVGLGIPTYAIVTITGVDISVRFVILCVVIDTIMYACLFALFLPSVIPLLKKSQKSKLQSRVNPNGQSTWYRLLNDLDKYQKRES